jgi:glucose/arabinose dehydrogenase
MEATGNILVIDGFTETNSKKALFRVNPITQSRTILSDFGNPGQGVLGYRPIGVAVEANGDILVVDPVALLLFRVNPQTGARVILSNFGRGLNQGRSLTGGIAVEADGAILVTDATAGTNQHGALLRVHSGFRTVLSDFGKSSAPGDPVVVPVGVAVEANGSILVVGPREGLDKPYGVLFRINPQTGARTVVSDFGDITKGFRGRSPVGVAVEATGNILVVDESAEGELLGSSEGTLFRIDPVSGFRTQLSFFIDPRQGPLGLDPVGVAVRKR